MSGKVETRWITLDEAVARGGASSAFASRQRRRTRVQASYQDGRPVTNASGKKLSVYNPLGGVRRAANVADIVDG